VAVDFHDILSCISGRFFHVNGKHFVYDTVIFRIDNFPIGHPAAYDAAFAIKYPAENTERFRSADSDDSYSAFTVGG
jgi:hypothetical protein